MNPKAVAKLAAPLLMIVAATMLAPLLLAAWQGDARSVFAYLVSGLSCAAVALLLRGIGRKQSDDLHRKDAIGVVVLIWSVMSVFGALPFLLDGGPLTGDLAAALFEAVSGFTTTGATVAGDVEEFSDATNLWRCEMHWIGGMGIVVLFVAVFPQLGVGAKQLFRIEVPGPTSEGLRPRIKQTAVALWWIYGGLTALCAGLLVLVGMPVFDAICHAMSTLGTGGFSPKAASIGEYRELGPVVDWIVAAFMLIAGLNFGLYYAVVRGRPGALFESPETRFYLALNAIVIAVVGATIWARHSSLLETARYSTFQVLAVTTTTGFMTEDFDSYPDVARYLLFLCMFIGGCAGSTAGGIKVVRVLLLLKVSAREFRSLAAPNVVETIKLGRTSIPPGVISGVLVFFATYMLIFAATSLLLVGLGMPTASEPGVVWDPLVSAMTATVACLSSVGPGLDAVGPTMNFGDIPWLGQLALSVCMVAGRLELFVLLSVFSRELWRR